MKILAKNYQLTKLLNQPKKSNRNKAASRKWKNLKSNINPKSKTKAKFPNFQISHPPKSTKQSPPKVPFQFWEFSQVSHHTPSMHIAHCLPESHSLPQCKVNLPRIDAAASLLSISISSRVAAREKSSNLLASESNVAFYFDTLLSTQGSSFNSTANQLAI